MATKNSFKSYSQKEADQLEYRLARAKDNSTPPFVLKDLSKDPDPQVRSFVASNPGTPEACLWDLTFDPDVRIRENAFKTLDDLEIRKGVRKPSLSDKIKSAASRAEASSLSPQNKSKDIGPQR